MAWYYILYTAGNHNIFAYCMLTIIINDIIWGSGFGQFKTTRVKKMVFSAYEKERMIYYYCKGMKAPTIRRKLLEEGIVASREGIHKFLSRFLECGSILRQPGSGRPSKITAEIKKIVDDQMELDDETTAHQLHSILTNMGYNISLRTILRCQKSLGWTFRGSAYCQLIRDVNKQKRLEWALKYKDDQFLDVIYTDECTVQMESHRRHCCRKKNRAPRLKPRYL